MQTARKLLRFIFGGTGGSEGADATSVCKSRNLPSHLVGQLVLAEADVNCVTQEAVARPVQIGELGDQLRLDQWTRERTSGYPKRVLRGGGTLRGEVLRASGSRRLRRSASTLSDIPVPTRPGVDELAVIRMVTKQQRA